MRIAQKMWGPGETAADVLDSTIAAEHARLFKPAGYRRRGRRLYLSDTLERSITFAATRWPSENEHRFYLRATIGLPGLSSITASTGSWCLWQQFAAPDARRTDYSLPRSPDTRPSSDVLDALRADLQALHEQVLNPWLHPHEVIDDLLQGCKALADWLTPFGLPFREGALAAAWSIQMDDEPRFLRAVSRMASYDDPQRAQRSAKVIELANPEQARYLQEMLA